MREKYLKDNTRAGFDTVGKIFALAKKRGWSTYNLSDHSGVKQSTISGWSSGRNQPSLEALEKVVCIAFKMTLYDFFMPEETDIDKKISIKSRSLSMEKKEQLLTFIGYLEYLDNDDSS